MPAHYYIHVSALSLSLSPWVRGTWAWLKSYFSTFIVAAAAKFFFVYKIKRHKKKTWLTGTSLMLYIALHRGQSSQPISLVELSFIFSTIYDNFSPVIRLLLSLLILWLRNEWDMDDGKIYEHFYRSVNNEYIQFVYSCWWFVSLFFSSLLYRSLFSSLFVVVAYTYIVEMPAASVLVWDIVVVVLVEYSDLASSARGHRQPRSVHTFRMESIFVIVVVKWVYIGEWLNWPTHTRQRLRKIERERETNVFHEWSGTHTTAIITD